LCVGLIHINESEGLNQATKIYDDLLKTFWDDLFPLKKRMNGRISAIQWWMDRTLLALEDDFHLNVEPATYIEMTQRLDRIQTFLEESHELDISAFGLVRAVEKLDPAKMAPTSTVPTPDNVPDVEITNPENAAKQLSPVFKQLKQASKIVREDDTANPQSYRWLRFGLWESVKAVPIATDNITKLAPPKEQIFTHLETLKNDEEWEKLVLAAESALNNPASIFAFDINWYSAEALMNLGEQYKHAHTIVCQETFMFISKLPGVEELLFSNETPFANEETKQWLKSLSTAEPGKKSSDSANLNEDEENYVSQTIKEARAVLRKKNGKVNSASFLHQAINRASSKKDSFILRLELVRILAAKRSEKEAIGHLNQILDDILEY
ncbi:MAG: type VI secretion system protein, partial [Desulfobacteraceae bacterium]|nr:type VI secretion system protein [Desulfobacteraceae bacterium]